MQTYLMERREKKEKITINKLSFKSIILNWNWNLNNLKCEIGIYVLKFLITFGESSFYQTFAFYAEKVVKNFHGICSIVKFIKECIFRNRPNFHYFILDFYYFKKETSE